MISLRYEILKEELYMTKFPFSKVLQQKYLKGCSINPALDIFKSKIRAYLYTCDRNSSMEDINTEIYSIVKELKNKYPLCFDTTGWYTKNILAYLYEEGRLTYDGHKVYPAEIEAKELIKQIKIEERYRLQEEKEEYEKKLLLTEIEEYNSLRETTREYIIPGTTFKSKNDIYEAFNEHFPKPVNNRIRMEIINSICKIEYSAPSPKAIRVWTVTEVFIPNKGRVYTIPKFKV